MEPDITSSQNVEVFEIFTRRTVLNNSLATSEQKRLAMIFLRHLSSEHKSAAVGVREKL